MNDSWYFILFYVTFYSTLENVGVSNVGGYGWGNFGNLDNRQQTGKARANDSTMEISSCCKGVGIVQRAFYYHGVYPLAAKLKTFLKSFKW